MQEERIAQHFERMNHIDVIAMGIGSNKPSFSAIVRAGQINKEESEGLLAAGAVGDICGIQLDALGHVAKTDFSGRIMSIDPDVLLKVPIRIGVAAGSEKLETTLAGLRGGFINVLVMDEVSARRVLRVQEMDPKPVRARS